jgi:hypothetical protein
MVGIIVGVGGAIRPLRGEERSPCWDDAGALGARHGVGMIWAILALIGVPLWLCAIGILTLVMRNRELRKRPGNVPVRVRPADKTRWTPAHALWVSDVLAYRGSPAAWKEGLFRVTAASERPADAKERKHLRRIGDDPVIATLTVDDGDTTRQIDVAARASDALTLLGPYAANALAKTETAMH